MSDTTLRKIMTDDIKMYGWLDFYFERGDNNAKKFKDDYKGWLDSLSARDFLYSYLIQL